MNCPKCHSVKYVKAGFSKGKQRLKCKDCSRHFVENNTKEYPREMRRQAIQLYLEGLGFRSIERILGMSNVTVMNWVKELGQSIQKMANLYPAKAEIIELDEIHHYVAKKRESFGSGLSVTLG